MGVEEKNEDFSLPLLSKSILKTGTRKFFFLKWTITVSQLFHVKRNLSLWNVFQIWSSGLNVAEYEISVWQRKITFYVKTPWNSNCTTKEMQFSLPCDGRAKVWQQKSLRFLFGLQEKWGVKLTNNNYTWQLFF